LSSLHSRIFFLLSFFLIINNNGALKTGKRPFIIKQSRPRTLLHLPSPHPRPRTRWMRSHLLR
jgi:hypothetical protein